MKRFLAVFLVLLIAFNSVSVSQASFIHDILDQDLGNAGNLSYEDNMAPPNTILDAVADNTFTEVMSGIIKTVYEVIFFIPKMLISWFLKMVLKVLPSMEDIVFSNSWSIWGQAFRLTFFDNQDTFSIASGFRSSVSALYQGFRYIAVGFFLIVISVLGIKILIASIGAQKARYKELLKHWVVGLLLLVCFHWVMMFSIDLNNYFVRVLVSVKDKIYTFNNTYDGWIGQAMSNIDGLTDAMSDAEGKLTNLAGGISLTTYFAASASVNILNPIGIILDLVALGTFIYINFQVVAVYVKRVIVVAVLIILFPVVAVFYVLDRSGLHKGDIFGTWCREFFANVFIQTIHALILVILLAFMESNVAQFFIQLPFVGLIFYLILLNMLFTIENMVEKVFSMSGTATLGKPVDLAKTVAQMGTAGIMSGKALKKAGWTTGQMLNPFGTKETRKAFNEGLKDIPGSTIGTAKDAANALGDKWGGSRKTAFGRALGTGAGKAVGAAGGFVGGAIGSTAKAITSSSQFIDMPKQDQLAIGKVIATTTGGYVGGQVFDQMTQGMRNTNVDPESLKRIANGSTNDSKDTKTTEKNIKITLSKFNDSQFTTMAGKLGLGDQFGTKEKLFERLNSDKPAERAEALRAAKAITLGLTDRDLDSTTIKNLMARPGDAVGERLAINAAVAAEKEKAAANFQSTEGIEIAYGIKGKGIKEIDVTNGNVIVSGTKTDDNGNVIEGTEVKKDGVKAIPKGETVKVKTAIGEGSEDKEALAETLANGGSLSSMQSMSHIGVAKKGEDGTVTTLDGVKLDQVVAAKAIAEAAGGDKHLTDVGVKLYNGEELVKGDKETFETVISDKSKLGGKNARSFAGDIVAAGVESKVGDFECKIVMTDTESALLDKGLTISTDEALALGRVPITGTLSDEDRTTYMSVSKRKGLSREQASVCEKAGRGEVLTVEDVDAVNKAIHGETLTDEENVRVEHIYTSKGITGDASYALGKVVRHESLGSRDTGALQELVIKQQHDVRVLESIQVEHEQEVVTYAQARQKQEAINVEKQQREERINAETQQRQEVVTVIVKKLGGQALSEAEQTIYETEVTPLLTEEALSSPDSIVRKAVASYVHDEREQETVISTLQGKELTNEGSEVEAAEELKRRNGGYSIPRIVSNAVRHDATAATLNTLQESGTFTEDAIPESVVIENVTDGVYEIAQRLNTTVVTSGGGSSGGGSSGGGSSGGGSSGGGSSGNVDPEQVRRIMEEQRGQQEERRRQASEMAEAHEQEKIRETVQKLNDNVDGNPEDSNNTPEEEEEEDPIDDSFIFHDDLYDSADGDEDDDDDNDNK